MTFKNTPFLYAFIFLLLAVVVGFGIFFSFFIDIKKNTDPLNIIPEFDSAKERAGWSKRMNEIGVEQTYAEFKEENASRHFSIQHFAAHIMGELLYDKKGIKGLTVCDSAFAFGCYHSFFGRALSEQGMEVISDLNNACLEKYGPLGTGCLHGIGHGLVEYIGHNKLVAALNACTMTTQVNPLFGCTSGAFMEYNNPIIITAENIYSDERKLDKSNPHEPCNTIVPEKFRKSCYFEIGLWWKQVFGEDYAKLGKLCQEIINMDYQESCYLGIGTVIAPSSDFDVKESINMCKKMPDDTAELTCRAGASWIFFAVPEQRSLAPAVCEGLEENDKNRCLLKANLIGEKI